MKCNRVTPFKPLKFKLSEETLANISKSTKLTKDELANLSLKEQVDLMEKRGSIGKPNPVKTFFEKMYRRVGEELGLISKEKDTYTHIDCKRTHGLIICSTWFDFLRQL